jgi:hypothetical protein
MDGTGLGSCPVASNFISINEVSGSTTTGWVYSVYFYLLVRSTLILFFHLRLGVPSGPFPLDIASNTGCLQKVWHILIFNNSENNEDWYKLVTLLDCGVAIFSTLNTALTAMNTFVTCKEENKLFELIFPSLLKVYFYLRYFPNY